jgi:hypothetical protein
MINRGLPQDFMNHLIPSNSCPIYFRSLSKVVDELFVLDVANGLIMFGQLMNSNLQQDFTNLTTVWI